MKTFAIIGLGYIAEKHIQSIYKLGGKVLAAYDINSNVGWLDKYDRSIYFANNEEEFFDKTKDVDCTVICTPNYLHYDHIVKSKSENVICEKPLCLNMEDFRKLELLNDEKNIYVIKQLRTNAAIRLFKIFKNDKDFYNVNIRYTTPRGDWYRKTWKNDINKSGGLLYNIGVHLFDLVVYLFGKPKEECHIFPSSSDAMAGVLLFDKAEVSWILSIEQSNEPVSRLFTINGELLDLSSNEQHIEMYKEIFAGNGVLVSDIRDTMQLVSDLSNLVKD